MPLLAGPNYPFNWTPSHNEAHLPDGLDCPPESPVDHNNGGFPGEFNH